MSKLIMTKGLPGSGKSTWAKELVNKEPGKWKRVNKDDLRRMMDDYRFSKHNEAFVLRIRDSIIINAISDGFNVIVDDTNLNPIHEERIRNLVKSSIKNVTIEIKDFTDIPIETCIERDLQRLYSVGEKVIRRMYKEWLKPKIDTVAPEYDPKLRDVIICDLDGTLALFGDRNPYDRDFEEDYPNLPVVDVVKKYIKDEAVIFVSGRKEQFRTQTLNWLSKHLGGFAPLLFMRKDDDTRKDYIIKQEIYESYIKGKYNIKFILDDRNQVVELWRSLGLPCFQVAEGEF